MNDDDASQPSVALERRSSIVTCTGSGADWAHVVVRTHATRLIVEEGTVKVRLSSTKLKNDKLMYFEVPIAIGRALSTSSYKLLLRTSTEEEQ